MNSTSADDRGGRLALVDEGNVLLGMPGAPGCTTTGFPGEVCCERVNEGEESKDMSVPRKMQFRNVMLRSSPAQGRR